MDTRTGLDQWAWDGFAKLKGKTVGVVCHQASISRGCTHMLDLMLPGHESGKFQIGACFGPQHGIWGHTQDNMVEWEGYADERTGLKFYSLYGEHRQPTPEMLAGLDELVFDVQDVGARYYTFIWTLALCLKACEPLGIPVTILDRPNPIGGAAVEGPGHDPAFSSFVGLYSLPVRHGLTIGEVGRYLVQSHFPKAKLEVVPVARWQRHWHFPSTLLPWGMPSPNMPAYATALVYPGQCLLEGTKLSEGRGTCRPFEIFGAPYIDGWQLCRELNALGLPGAVFRPYVFQPTFHKFVGQVCEGAFIHVVDTSAYRPVLTSLSIIQAVIASYPDQFEWQVPPYEYEFERKPFDILIGHDKWRGKLESGIGLSELQHEMEAEAEAFEPRLAEARIYG